MFKISVPITKTQKKGNKLIVEGYASDTTIDRDEERFSESAIRTMKDSVRSGGVKVRLEHEDKFYTNIGEWTDADITKNNRLYVKGEIDTELSLGKDVEVLLKRGEKLELSVGGRVLDATTEYSSKARRTIKVYTNVVLEEISILMNPSNYNTSLGIAKTVDWEKLNEISKGEKKDMDHVPYTTEAQKAYQIYKNMQPLKPEVFEVGYKERGKGKGGKKMGTVKEWLAYIDDEVHGVLKDYCESEAVDVCCDMDAPLTVADLQTISKLTQIMTQVELPTAEEEEAMLYSDDYWMQFSDLGEDGYIILSDRTTCMPHHNPDYTVNREWVLIRLKQLIDGQNYWKPKDFSIAINHLYKHLKELELIKSAKLTNSNPENTMQKHDNNATELSKEELDLLKNAHDFAFGKTTEVPKMPTGEEMSKETIEKCALAYDKLSKSTNFNSLIDNSMKKAKVVKTETTEVVADKEVETPVETTPETTDAPETTTEVAEGTEVETVETPVETEEKPKEDAPVTEDTPEEKEEEAPVETTEEEPKVEEKEEEKPSEEEPVKEEEPKKEEEPLEPKSAKKVEPGVTKAQISKVEKQIAGFQKSVDAVMKSVNDVTTKLGDIEKSVTAVSKLQADVTKMTEVVDKLSQLPLRKGVASYSAMEKAMQGLEAGDKAVDFQTLLDANLSKGMAFPVAYQKAKEAMLNLA